MAIPAQPIIGDQFAGRDRLLAAPLLFTKMNTEDGRIHEL
jgi:hypothetical protein